MKVTWLVAGLVWVVGTSSAAAWWTGAARTVVVGVFGPPVVVMEEAYAGQEGQAFDHGVFDALLREHVTEAGLVDYVGLRGDRAALQGYLAELGRADFAALSRDAKLAFLINAYNAFTLELILDHGGSELESIYDIPEAQRWKAERWLLAGERRSLDAVEHEIIRERFREPRIHWALVCAAVSCPPLRREAYTGVKLEQQLAEQAAIVHAGPWVRYDADANTLHLTALYEWFAGDFEQVHGSVLAAVAQHVPAVRDAMERGDPPRVEFMEYDWSLNNGEREPSAALRG